MRNKNNPFELALPSNIEAEKAVLGAVLLDERILPQATTILEGDDFFLDSNKRIYRKMRMVAQSGRKIDPITLQDALRNSGELDLVGGPAYIAALIDGVPRFTNIDEYCRIVKGKSILRKIIKQTNYAMELAFEQDTEGEEILLQLQNWCSKTRAGVEDKSMVPHADVVREVWAEIQGAQANPSAAMGIRTGFPRVDYSINGAEKGDLITLAGASSLGKTTMALQWAMNAARGYQGQARKVVPLYVTLEIPPKKLVYKTLATRTGISVRKMKQGNISSEELGEISLATIEAEDIEMEYVAKIKDTKRAIAGFIERLQLKTKNQADIIVFIDTLQLSARAGNEESQFAAIARASEEMKELTMDYNVPIVQLSQLTVPTGATITTEPDESWLRGAKSIFHDSDKVFILHCPDGLDSTRRQLIKRKDREGERVEYFELDFDGARSQFMEAAR